MPWSMKNCSTSLNFMFRSCTCWNEAYFIQKGILVKMGIKGSESQGGLKLVGMIALLSTQLYKTQHWWCSLRFKAILMMINMY